MLSVGQKRDQEQKFSDRIVPRLLDAVQWFFCLIGPRATFWVFSRLAKWRLRVKPSRMIESAVHRAYGDDESAAQQVIKGVYEAAPLTLAELVLQPHWKRHGTRYARDNFDDDWLQPYLNNEAQAMFLIGHFAGWEANIIHLSRRLSNLHGVYAPPKNPLMERFFNQGRLAKGSDWTLYPRDLPDLQDRLMKAVTNGGSLIYALDAPLPGPMLPFMGKTSPTTLKPYQMAAHMGMPIIPIRAGRDPEGLGFYVELEKPLSAKGTTEADVIAFATEMNGVYTRWINENPTQWYWADKFFVPNKRWEDRQAAKAKAKGKSQAAPKAA